MSQLGVHKFIATVSLHYPRPKFNDDDTMGAAWTASMNRVLSGFADDVLAEAAQRVLETRNPKKDGRFFPVPQECTEVCREILEEHEARKTPLLAGPKDVPYEARVALARDLMKSPMGQLARRENWDVGMYEFCLEHMRVPAGADIEACKRAAKEFRAGYERLLKDGHPLKSGLAQLANNIVSKARELMGDAP